MSILVNNSFCCTLSFKRVTQYLLNHNETPATVHLRVPTVDLLTGKKEKTVEGSLPILTGNVRRLTFSFAFVTLISKTEQKTNTIYYREMGQIIGG